jgi:hypothetical protein
MLIIQWRTIAGKVLKMNIKAKESAGKFKVFAQK